MKTHSFISLCALAAVLAVEGCSVGPDYRRADVETPATFSESAPWKQATPSDAIAKGDWWTVFNDPALNELQTQATANNQDLRAAVARVDQARAISRVAKSEFFPSVDANAGGSFYRTSSNSDLVIPGLEKSDVSASLGLNYELDIWGRVRRSVEASTANLQASVADYEFVRLAMHAELAQTYFSLRSFDAEIAILAKAIDLRRQELDLIHTRYKAGSSSDLDVARAETALTDAQAELSSVRGQRSELEHALAVLIGKTAESFQIAATPLSVSPPSIPTGVPSDLLERRPDVAEAERRMAASNAEVGIATAAFFPVVRLTGTAGFESVDLGSLFNWPSRMWSVGPSLTLPIFEGGRNTANLERSKARYDETTANYRQQVLTAFKEVENNLSTLRNLSDRAEAQRSSVSSSQRAYQLSDLLYRNGSANYLDVIDAERTMLESQRAEAQTLGQRYVASILLVKALGGGWNDSRIKSFASSQSDAQP